jgi:membrane-associated phospholipid phosphatase
VSEPAKSRWKWAVWLLAGVALIALAFPFDDRVDAVLVVPPRSQAHDIAWWCSEAGLGGVIGAAGIFFAIVFLLLNRPRVAAAIFFVALTSSITGLVAALLKVVFGRTRPTNHEVAQGFYGLWHNGHWIAGKVQFSSFPSGHSASAAGLAAAAWLVHRGWGAVAAVYALAVMWSRIALQCHHLSDVIASAVLSIPLAILMKHVLAPSIEFQFGNLHRGWRAKRT